jgi:hypothetical protein
MAMGKPVVAFALREGRVSAGDAAVYATPNDAVEFGEKILELLAAPEQRHRMGLRGRERFAQQLAWEHQERVLLALYRDLLGAPASPGSVDVSKPVLSPAEGDVLSRKSTVPPTGRSPGDGS